MCGEQWLEVRLTGPVPLGEQLPCTDLMVNTMMEHPSSPGSWKVLLWDVTHLDTTPHPMDHSLQGNSELHITTDGVKYLRTVCIYSMVVRSIVKYKTQWIDLLYYVHMCGKCTVDKPSSGRWLKISDKQFFAPGQYHIQISDLS